MMAPVSRLPGNIVPKPASPSSLPLHLSQPDFDAVFAGGYYIMYVDASSSQYCEIKTKASQRRIRKKEEILQLANLTRQIIENCKTLPAPQEVDPRIQRHEMLMQELQALVNRSGLVQNPHEEHLRHELDIARQQLLRNGSFDENVVMQTLQEIASEQGLSLAGSRASGKFFSEITVPSEHEFSQVEAVSGVPNESAVAAEDNSDFFHIHYLDRFSAYNIAEIGFFGPKHGGFFAYKLKDALQKAEELPHPEQTSSEELTP